MVENKFALFWMEDNILFFEFKPGVVINRMAAQQIVTDRLKTQKGKSYPILCNASKVFEINKEARDYFARHSTALTKAVGIVAPTKKLAFLMTSFYLKVYKPKVPTKLFSDKPAAIKFLTAFI